MYGFLRVSKEFKSGKVATSVLWTVGCVFLITAYAAYAFLRYTGRPHPYLPPWKDSATLGLAPLFFVAPVGMALSVFAGIGGASRRVVVPLLLAMLSLFLVGVLEGMSV